MSGDLLRYPLLAECVDTDETRLLLGALTHHDFAALRQRCAEAYDRCVVRPLAMLLAPLAAAANAEAAHRAGRDHDGKRRRLDEAHLFPGVDLLEALLPPPPPQQDGAAAAVGLLDDDALASALGLYSLECHFEAEVKRQSAVFARAGLARAHDEPPDQVELLHSTNDDDAAAIEGDEVHEQIQLDYHSGFTAHDGQAALFEIVKQMLGARIYGIRNWKRNWRTICRRNGWTDPKLRQGLAAAEMPRRFGKTTGAGRAMLCIAMNVPYFRGCVISLDFDTACILVNEVYEQMLRHPRFMRDFGHRFAKGCIVFWPRHKPQDLRVIFAIPGLTMTFIHGVGAAAPVRPYDPVIFGDVDRRILENLDAFRAVLYELQNMFFVTTARVSIEKLSQVGIDVFRLSIAYMRHRELGRPGPPTRPTVLAAAATVSAIRVPPRLRDKSAEIRALQARLTEIANDAPE